LGVDGGSGRGVEVLEEPVVDNGNDDCDISSEVVITNGIAGEELTVGVKKFLEEMMVIPFRYSQKVDLVVFDKAG